MHALGARHFIVMGMIPLQLTRLYANTDEPTIYWPDQAGRNGSAWHKAAYNYPNTVNRFLTAGIEKLNKEFRGRGVVQVSLSWNACVYTLLKRAVQVL